MFRVHLVTECGVKTAHSAQLSEHSENNIFGRKTVCDSGVSATCCTFGQFRDGTGLVHWKTAKLLMNQLYR